jgi:hypothetical protein
MDGPPPLEDCSDLIKQRKSKTTIPPPTVKQAPIVKAPVKNLPTNTDSSLLHLDNKPLPTKIGLKSGFFNTKPKQTKKHEKIETLKPKSAPLVFDSVQQAIGKDSWTSPDFLAQIDANPILGTNSNP